MKEVELRHVKNIVGDREGFYAVYGNDMITLTRDQAISIYEIFKNNSSISEEEKWGYIKEVTKNVNDE